MPDRSPPPRVGLNAALLSLGRDYRAAGIHRYIVALLGALAEAGGVHLTAFGPSARAREVLPRGVGLRPAPRWASRPIGRIAWEQAVLPVGLARARSDLHHAPAHAMPVCAPCPSVVTVHDLSFFRLPEAFPRLQALYLRSALRHAACRARALVAVSAFTARELEAVLGISDDRVHVVPNGIDAHFRPVPPDLAADVTDRLALPPRFVLAVGTLQPRKNLGTLLEAYARLLAASPDAPDLVVAGGAGWGGVRPSAAAERLGIAERVNLPGYVADDDLPALYTSAVALACPSRYEGFGLPVLEAMACGTPAVVADAGALPEVTGDGGVVVAVDDPAAWTDALGGLLANPERRAALARAGRARAARFTWARTARETLAVYRHALARGRSMPAREETPRGPA